MFLDHTIFSSLSTDPFRFFSFSIKLDSSNSMHLIIFPSNLIYFSIWKVECSLSIFKIIHKVPVIYLGVRPIEFSLTVHLAIHRLAIIFKLSVGGKFPHPMHHIIGELTYIECPFFFPCQGAISVFLPIFVLPFIFLPITPRASTKPMRLVVFPVAFVNIPVFIEMFSLTFSLTIHPIPLIYISVDVNNSTFPIGLVILKLSMIKRSILVILFAHPVLFPFLPSTYINIICI